MLAFGLIVVGLSLSFLLAFWAEAECREGGYFGKQNRPEGRE